MKQDLYDKLILRNQDEVKNQGYIVLTNIDVDLFETQVNFVKNLSNSVLITVRKFLHGPGDVLAIEQTIDTEDLRK